MRRKNEELVQAYREKNRKLLQTQELYDKVKRKADMGNIQRAACDAVDSSLNYANQHMASGPGDTEDPYHYPTGDQQITSTTSQGHGFENFGSMNTGLPRVKASLPQIDTRWDRRSELSIFACHWSLKYPNANTRRQRYFTIHRRGYATEIRSCNATRNERRLSQVWRHASAKPTARGQ